MKQCNLFYLFWYYWIAKAGSFEPYISSFYFDSFIFSLLYFNTLIVIIMEILILILILIPA